jgi:dTDP-4-dehydrorhamnose reductase
MILVLGSNGYVGSAVIKYLQQNSVEYKTFQARYPLHEDVLQRFIINNKIESIINCAGFVGMPNVDSCESINNKVPCLYANALLPAQLLKICKKLNIRLSHVSSGCIYSDAACDRALAPTVAFTEEDVPNFDFDSNNASWYSATKALGETLMINSKYYDFSIFRLRIPFNGVPNNRNYLTKLCNYDVLLNATNSLSNLDEFAGVVAEATLQGGGSEVIFNVTQPGHIKTQEVVEMLQKAGIVKDKKWFKNIEEFNRTIRAPRSNCVLDSSLALKAGFKLTPIQDSLMLAIDEYKYNLSHS